MSQLHPTEDHYATLGVPPRSEAGAIRAAYLDLMRRFHPDRNDTPEAVGRAHAIIAAFAVLGDVERRLHYDWARRRAAEEAAEAQRRSAMIRKALVAAALSIVVLPLSFLALGSPDSRPRPAPAAPTPAAKGPPSPLRPTAEPLIADLPAASLVAPVAPVAAVAAPFVDSAPAARETAPPAARPAAAPSVPAPRAAAAAHRGAAAPPEIDRPGKTRQARNAVTPRLAPATAYPRCRSVNPGAETAICNNDNLTALDRSVVTFYNQSLKFADPAKRGALLDARIGFLLRREECRSDACLQGVHLAHLRELSSIVERGQSGPPR